MRPTDPQFVYGFAVGLIVALAVTIAGIVWGGFCSDTFIV